ncbi:MAG: ABC transporter permease [Bacteroidota bacterium]
MSKFGYMDKILKFRYIILLIYPLFTVLILLAIFTYNPKSILSGILNPEILSSVKLSLISALVATVFTIIVGTPLAYYLARHNFFGKSLIETLIDLPISIPPLVCGVGLLLLFGANGWIGNKLMAFGIHIVFTLKGAIIAQFFISAPLFIKIMQTTFTTIDSRFETVARTLGSSPLESFFKITIPLSWDGIINGTTMSFARCLGEFGATLMIASAITFKTETLPLAVFMNMSTGNIELAISAASILIIISLFTIISMRICGNYLKK